VNGVTCVEMRMRSKRDRQSLRADKYWQSIWHRQMLFKTKPLTSVLSCDRTKEIHGNKELSQCPDHTSSISSDQKSMT